MALVAALLLLLSTANVEAIADDSTVKKTVEPKVPQFQPWRIYVVPNGGALVFNCPSDVPTLRVTPPSGSAQHIGNGGDMLLSTMARTPAQYKYGRLGKPDTGYFALYWAAPGGGKDGAGLMPAPKMQLIAIPKAVAAVMEVLWKEEKGEAMPDSVLFPADTVVFYHKEWFVIMGREDVEFRQPPAVVHGEIHALTLGTVM